MKENLEESLPPLSESNGSGLEPKPKAIWYKGKEYTGTVHYLKQGGHRLPQVMVNCEGQTVAEADISYDKDSGVANIDWFSVSKDYRGRGYASGSYSVVLQKLSEMKKISAIDSTTQDVHMMRVRVNAIMPEGWRRLYELHGRDESYLELMDGSEPTLDAAIDCIENGGYVLQRLERQT